MTSKNKAALEAILPCPFCGAKPVIERGNNGSDDGTYDCSIECKNPLCEVSCGHVGFTVCSDKEAIDVWNKRAPLTPHPPAWQEIGSAPRDGTGIYIRIMNKDIVEAEWAYDGVCDVTGRDKYKWFSCGHAYVDFDLYADHELDWQPHPPSEGEKK